MNRDRVSTIDDREVDDRTAFILSQSSEQQEFSIRFNIQLRFLSKSKSFA